MDNRSKTVLTGRLRHMREVYLLLVFSMPRIRPLAALVHIDLLRSADAQRDDNLASAGRRRAPKLHRGRGGEGEARVIGGRAPVGFLGLLVVKDRKLLHPHQSEQVVDGKWIDGGGTCAFAHRCSTMRGDEVEVDGVTEAGASFLLQV